MLFAHCQQITVCLENMLAFHIGIKSAVNSKTDIRVWSSNDRKDQLSDHVYHYDAKEKVFELAEKFDARKKEMSAEKHAEKDSVLKDLSAEKKEVADAPKVKSDRALKKDEASL